MYCYPNLSQSLVNEGRFPLEGAWLRSIYEREKSQSLVNEGRFPPDLSGQTWEVEIVAIPR